MSRRFPKVGEQGTFPYLDTVQPFSRKNDFDYARYDYTATAKLCRVTWPSDYRHVVNWTSAQARDAWFAALDGHVVELSHGTLRTQTDQITLNVPYDVALTYNYVYMRVPELTEGRPIDHETGEGVRTVGAFIVSCEYLSPSATSLTLDVDVWTTYLPYQSVSGCTLLRGHAPMWALDADTYLQKPIERCANLLTPDVGYGTPDVVRGGSFKPLSTAAPIYVIASTIPYADIDDIETATTQNTTPATYYDTGARNGEQVGVRGYQWGGGKSYEGMTSPSTPTRADGALPTGLYYYGVRGADVARGALATLLEGLPVLATSCKAAFVVPSDLVTVGTRHSVAGVSVYEVANKGLQTLVSFPVTKALFGYDERYRDIAKLYTEPYAHLEVSDDLGNSCVVAIEDTQGAVDVSQMLSIAFPALEWRAAITNVANTGGTVRYSWSALDGTTSQRTVPNADLAQTFIDFGIPTYALYLEGRTAQAVTTWAQAQQQRNSAIVAYQNTMRSANTGEHNAYDGNATAKANADASADTAKANADDSADTAKANTTRSTTNMRTNAARDNSYRSTAEQNSRNYTANTAAIDLDFMRASTIAALQNNQIGAIAGINNIVASGAGSVASNLLSENYAGAAISAVGAAAGALNAGASYAMTVSTDANLATASMQAATEKATESAALGYANVQNANAQNTEITENNATTADSNATDMQTMTKGNATRSQTTAKANASRTQTTGNANAGYTRDTTEENAKATLENARIAYQQSLDAAGMEPARAYGDYAGPYAHEIWQNRGIHLRAVTQSASGIKLAGDTFLRYGYQLNAAWTIDTWVPEGRTYCYWQSNDLWLNVADVSNAEAERLFESILAAGVTVWDKPEHVGRFMA